MLTIYTSPICIVSRLDCAPLCLSGFTGTENVGTGNNSYGDSDFD